MRRHPIYIIIVCLMLTGVSSGCRKLVEPTNVRIEHPVRHYLPILQGDVLRMFWTVYNDGPEPLVIQDVQPSCSAVKLMSELPGVVMKGDSVVMLFHFDTGKNINLARHAIRLYGNIEPDGEAQMEFDVHIVRPSEDHSDYEELFFSKQTEAQNATPTERRNLYYTDSLSTEVLFGYEL